MLILTYLYDGGNLTYAFKLTRVIQNFQCTLPVFPLENKLHLANKLESPLQLFLSSHLDLAEMINII